MPRSLSTRSGLLALLVLVSPILVAAPGCSEEPSQAAAQAPARDPHALVAAGATLLDVRTPEEFSERHLEGAVNIPVDQVEARMSEIPRDRPVVVYCRSGARSMSAARILRRGGYDVEDLGSINEW